MNKKIFAKMLSIFLSFLIILSTIITSVSVFAAESINIKKFSFVLEGSTVTVNSPYGYRIHPIYGYKKMHSGVDLNAYMGDKTLAWKNGTVVEAYSSCKGTHVTSSPQCSCYSSYGNYVVIDHGYYDGQSIRTLYAHLSKVNVKNGDKVKQSQVIGLIGSSGSSTGPHLHFEVRLNGNYVNPCGFIGIKNEAGSQKVTNISTGLQQLIPEKPTVKIASANNSKVKFSWSAKNATLYKVEKRVNGKSWQVVYASTKSKELTINNINSGTKIDIRVTGKNEDETGPVSEIVTYYSMSKVKNLSLGFAKINEKDENKSFEKIKITWDAVPGAKQYEIYRKRDSGYFSKIKTVSANDGCKYFDTKIDGNKTYEYKVRASLYGNGDFSNIKKINTPYRANIKKFTRKNNKEVIIEMNQYKGEFSGGKYQVYVKKDNGNYNRFSTPNKNNIITCSGLSGGIEYRFKVKYIKNNTETDFSDYYIFRTIKKCEITGATLKGKTSAKISWKKLDYVNRYKLNVIDKTSSSTKTMFFNDSEMKPNKNNEVSTTLKNLIPGNKYEIEVRGQREGIYGDYSKKVSIQPLMVPYITDYGLSATNKGFITWETNSKQENFEIQRKVNNGEWTTLKTVKGTVLTFTDKNYKDKTEYSYRLRAVSGDIKTNWSNVVSIKKLSNITTLSIVEYEEDYVSIEWGSVNGALGYDVYRAKNSGNYEKIITLTSGHTEFDDEDVSQGNVYSYYIKAFSGKVYTKDSNKVKAILLDTPVVSEKDSEFKNISTLFLKWGEIKNCDGYEVFVSINGDDFEKHSDTSKCSITLNNVDIGDLYRIKVRAFSYLDEKKSSRGYSKFSGIYEADVQSTGLSVPVPGFSYTHGQYSVNNSNSGYITIKTTADASSKSIMYKFACITNDGKEIDSGYTYSDSYTFTNLTVGKTYKIKVKAAITTSGNKKIEGKWSEYKNVKIYKRYVEFPGAIDLGDFSGKSSIFSPQPEDAYGDAIVSYGYLYSDVSGSLSKYKAEMKAIGYSYTQETTNGITIIEFSTSSSVFYVAHNKTILKASDSYDDVILF